MGSSVFHLLFSFSSFSPLVCGRGGMLYICSFYGENDCCIVVAAVMTGWVGSVQLHPTASQCGQQREEGPCRDCKKERDVNEDAQQCSKELEHNEGVLVGLATCSCSSCRACRARSR